MEIRLENNLTLKVSSKYMSAIADSVGFKLMCNVHVWAYFEKLSVSGKNIFYKKMAYGLGQDISCITFLVVSDIQVLFK